MTMDILKTIINFASAKGLVLTIHVTAIGTFVYFLVKSESFRTRVSDALKRLIRFNRTDNHGYTQDDLKNHALFTRLRKYINYDIQHFKLGEPLREAIFKDFLLFKFTALQKHFENFLSKGDLTKMSDGLYKSRMLECVDEIIKTYERKAVEEGIPNIVIIKFNNWHRNRIEAVYDYISQVCDDDLFESNIIKTRMIFDFIVHINNFTLIDAKKTLIHMNGELSKETYKGIKAKDKLHKDPDSGMFGTFKD